MGALALPTPWIPEDDLLLKNAIEAGASLESLAKGAVQFSRRFTIKELQDRWLALLYDPIISTRAAEQMVELERSSSTLASKSNKASDSSKGMRNDHGNGKRKVESVRRCYYAMRKRVCSEPLNQDDLAFLVGPVDNCFMSGLEAHVPGNILGGDSIASHFGIQHANFNGLGHDFSQITGNGAPVGEFPIKQRDTFEDHMGPSNMVANEMGIVEPSGHGMIAGSGTQANPDGKGIMCSGFEENRVFNPSISGCEAPFEHFQYPSPPPVMPDWKTVEDMSVPRMPDDISIRGKTIQSGDPFGIPDDGDAEGASEYEMQCDDDFQNPTGCNDGIFAALTDSLFNFTSEDELYIIDENLDGLKSLLLDSPNGAIDDRLPDVLKEREPAASIFIDIPSSSCPEGKNDAADPLMGDINLQSCSDTQMASSTALVDSEFPEFCNGVICCSLNTEDPEIPCNDDIVFPSKPRQSSSNRRTQIEAKNPSFQGKDSIGTQSGGKAFGTAKRDQKRFGESDPASQMRGLDVVPNRAVDESAVKFETPRAELFNVPSISSNSYRGPCQSSLVVKKEPFELPLARQPGCSITEKQGQVTDISCLQPAVVGISQETETSPSFRNQELPTPGSVDDVAAEPVGDPLSSDPIEQFSESDTDIPYYSDVESMILDMDLGPEDQDFFCSREVAKYQHEDVKKAIIRLEQNAHSYMQRAISSHGAFAILYGRHSKHYIKKPEVLLGRATDDVMVDIDLRREGRANKISRRQAIIKMGIDGAFSLKNTGKCSIYVNSKEIFPGQSLGLHSNCLIEIRGMPFIFDTNQTRVKQYLDNATRKFEDKKLNIGRVG